MILCSFNIAQEGPFFNSSELPGVFQNPLGLLFSLMPQQKIKLKKKIYFFCRCRLVGLEFGDILSQYRKKQYFLQQN
jgi:hypothetical protein